MFVVRGEREAVLPHPESSQELLWRLVHLSAEHPLEGPHGAARDPRERRVGQRLGEVRSPIAAIAAAHGFYDQSHFVREFRREFGLTPGQYRERHAGPAAARDVQRNPRVS